MALFNCRFVKGARFAFHESFAASSSVSALYFEPSVEAARIGMIEFDVAFVGFSLGG